MDVAAEYCVEPDLVERAHPTVALLRERQISVVTAESCTAGLIAAVLSHVPGAGEVLHGSFVAYSKALKVAALGVDAELLNLRGSVNEEVALAMARGALLHSSAQVALSVTGVLGPDADEDGNPAGLIYAATVSIEGIERVEAYRLSGFGPDEVRHEAVEQALKLLERVVIESPPRPPVDLFRAAEEGYREIEPVHS